jgi:hypothetical protein
VVKVIVIAVDTLTEISIVLVVPPVEVPVTLKVKLPAVAVLFVVKVRTLSKLGAPEAGEKLADVPVGVVPTQAPLTVTLSLIPSKKVMLTFEVAFSNLIIEIVRGKASSENNMATTDTLKSVVRLVPLALRAVMR